MTNLRCIFLNIKSDSRKIEKGDTFIALDGVNHHGHEYIEDAICIDNITDSLNKKLKNKSHILDII